MRRTTMPAPATAALRMALPATAAAGPGNAALAKQVRALSKKVTVLQARVNTLEGALSASGAVVDAVAAKNTEQDQAIALVDDKDTCTTAITWDGLDLIVKYLTGSTPNRIDDRGACARVGIVRSGSPAPFARDASRGVLRGSGLL